MARIRIFAQGNGLLGTDKNPIPRKLSQALANLQVQMRAAVDHPQLAEFKELSGYPKKEGNRATLYAYIDNVIIEAWKDKSHVFFTIYNDKDYMIAMASGRLNRFQQEFRIDDFIVESGNRGQGVGTELLTQICDWCARNNLGSVKMGLLAEYINAGADTFFIKACEKKGCEQEQRRLEYGTEFTISTLNCKSHLNKASLSDAKRIAMERNWRE